MEQEELVEGRSPRSNSASMQCMQRESRVEGGEHQHPTHSIYGVWRDKAQRDSGDTKSPVYTQQWPYTVMEKEKRGGGGRRSGEGGGKMRRDREEEEERLKDRRREKERRRWKKK